MSTVDSNLNGFVKEPSIPDPNSKSELSWEEVERLVDEIVFDVTRKYLNNLETTVLRGSYEGKTYQEMSGTDYQTPTLQEAGAELWEKLSKALKGKVKKTNFLQALKRYKESQAALNKNSIHTPLKASQPEATSMLVEVKTAKTLSYFAPGVYIEERHNSDFYVERRNVESMCERTILQSGALIRIRAPQRMGKTLLLGKLLDSATKEGYQTAKLDLQLADSNTLADLNTFRRWLCDEVLYNLDPQPNVEEYGQAFKDLNGNLTRFFQKYLLSNIESPLVLAIDSFEQLFKYPDIFREFCSYLRVWHDNAKQGDRVGKIWRKLRVVLVYSTETYPELETNHSPFNVGVAIDLPDFDPSEVTTLAKRYQLYEQLGEDGLSKLMKLVGGHPYFIQQAFANLKSQQMSLEEILHLAPTNQGIYSDYLRQQLWILQHNPQLESAYKQVVMTNERVRLDTEIAFKLHSLGLVKFSENDCIPRYDLLRQYFSVHLE